MSNTDKLTYLQLIALKGEIALMVSTAAHDAEIKYRIYMLLKGSNKKIRNYLIEAIKEAVTFNEEEVDRILLEVESKKVPVWLWIEKVIEDLKVALIVPDSNYSSKVSINKTEQRKYVVASAFIMFVRSVALLCPNSAQELCRRVLEENDFKFLYLACTELMGDIENIKEVRPPKALPNPSIMDIEFDIRELMSFMIEKQSVEDIIRTMKKPPKTRKAPVKDSGEDSKIMQALTEALLPSLVTQPKEEQAKFVVMKTFNGSHLTTALQSFETEEEAIDFVRKIEKDFPEIKKTCTIEIIKEKG